ncbi:MAG: alanine racemase [Actinomycetaceae bacterium]|nr:alanine racemase [Actinomycetaceae bacterium]
MSEQLAHYPASATINLEALTRNAKRMRQFAPNARHMGIVKADAYGHGRTSIAAALAKAGYDILGIAQLGEALKERRALDAAGHKNVAIFSWMLPPADEKAIQEALAARIELSASTIDQLERIANTGIEARVHLKVDTGMGRGGATPADFPALANAASRMETVNVVGVWSHFARADELGEEARAATLKQIQLFEDAVSAATEAGLTGFQRHIAATSGQIWYPEAHYDMVRDGIGLYGLSPDPSNTPTLDLGFEPIMTLGARLLQVKQVEAGQTVSYGGTWQAPTRRWLGLVPLGYGDGIPRHAQNAGPVSVYTAAGRIDTHMVGRVCMDQFVIDLGESDEAPAAVGDEVVLFGNPNNPDTKGCPTADDWADVAGTINYEIVTRLGARVPRAYS